MSSGGSWDLSLLGPASGTCSLQLWSAAHALASLVVLVFLQLSVALRLPWPHHDMTDVGRAQAVAGTQCHGMKRARYPL